MGKHNSTGEGRRVKIFKRLQQEFLEGPYYVQCGKGVFMVVDPRAGRFAEIYQNGTWNVSFQTHDQNPEVILTNNNWRTLIRQLKAYLRTLNLIIPAE